jgi:hypothetical protein
MRYKSVYTEKVNNIHLNLIRDLSEITKADYFRLIVKKPQRSPLFRTVERYGGGHLVLRLHSDTKTYDVITRDQFVNMFRIMLGIIQLRCPYGKLAKHFNEIGLNARSLHSYTRCRKCEPRLIVFLSLAVDYGWNRFEWVKR